MANGNYELTQTTPQIFNEYATLISNDNERYYSLSSNIWKNNLGNWELEAELTPIFGGTGVSVRVLNHSFSAYAQSDIGDYNGLFQNGRIVIYDYSGGVSTQKGNAIYGQFDEQLIGYQSISMDENASSLAYISSGLDGSIADVRQGQRAYVYSYDENSNEWVQKGQEFYCIRGSFVSIYLSEDGETVTLVKYDYEGTSTISRYYFTNDIWVQLGSSIPIPPAISTQNTSHVKMENNTIFVGWSQESLIKQF